MYNDNNHNGPARVRHVPIHIESRDDRQSQNQEGQNREQYDRQNLAQAGFIQRDHNQASPDTSSIDIEYKPSPPTRGQPQQFSPNSSANRQQQQFNSSRFNQQFNHPPQHFQHQSQQQHFHPHPQDYNQEQQHEARQSNNSNPSGSVSPNSEKLVNSPEPIPLPPPPNSNDQVADASDGNPGNQSKCPEQTQKPELREQKQQQPAQKTKDTSVMGMINSVKMDVMKLVKDISKFEGISSKCKEYRYLDEMLTRCILNLDNIQCGDAPELRQQRKAAILLVDEATKILQRKLQINTDIYNLSESMANSSSGSLHE